MDRIQSRRVTLWHMPINEATWTRTFIWWNNIVMVYQFKPNDAIVMQSIEERDIIRKMLKEQWIKRRSWSSIDGYWQSTFYRWWLYYVVKKYDDIRRISQWLLEELRISQWQPKQLTSEPICASYNVIQADSIINEWLNYLNLLSQ